MDNSESNSGVDNTPKENAVPGTPVGVGEITTPAVIPAGAAQPIVTENVISVKPNIDSQHISLLQSIVNGIHRTESYLEAEMLKIHDLEKHEVVNIQNGYIHVTGKVHDFLLKHGV